MAEAPKRSAEEAQLDILNGSISMNPSKRHKKDAATFMDPTSLVTFLVGEDKMEFIVHKEVACAASPVFDAAFNSPMIEGQTQTYPLSETSESAFRFLMQWIYKEKLNIQQLKELYVKADLEEGPKGSDYSAEWVTQEDRGLIEVYLLAEMCLMPRLQNHIIDILDACIQKSKRVPVRLLPYIYDHTPDESLLRRFFVDQLSINVSPSIFEVEPESFPHAALIDIAKAFAKRQLEDDMDEKSSAEFHVPIFKD